MVSYPVIIHAVLMVYGVIGLGIFLGKGEWLSQGVDRSLGKIVVQVLYPALIFDKIAGNPSLADTGHLVWAPAIGLVVVCTWYLVCWMEAPLFGLRTRQERGTFSFTSCTCNYGCTHVSYTHFRAHVPLRFFVCLILHGYIL